MSATITPSAKPNKPHFIALDSWRGIAACAVALHHFYANTPIFDAGIIRNAGAFVDFFFVLSGFVIAYNYQDKLRTGFSLKKFMALRLGRLYPLHITVLILMIAFEAIFANIISQYSSTARAPFSGPTSVLSIATNIFLLNGLGLHNVLTWNQAAWSISVEVFLYLTFAVTLRMMRIKQWLILNAVLILCCPVLLFFAVGYLETIISYAYVRGLFSFSVGVITYNLFSGPQLCPLKRAPSVIFSLVEVSLTLCLGSILWFIGEKSHLTLFLPFLFGILIIAFAFNRGIVSDMLGRKVFVRIGMLSYSIYMIHIFMQGRIINAAFLLEKISGFPLFSTKFSEGIEQRFIGTNWQQGLLATALMCVVVYIAAELSYRFIETPGRNFARKGYTSDIN